MYWKERYEICKKCEIAIKTKTGIWCDEKRGGCGCNMWLKVKIPIFHCPKGKW